MDKNFKEVSLLAFPRAVRRSITELEAVLAKEGYKLNSLNISLNEGG